MEYVLSNDFLVSSQVKVEGIKIDRLYDEPLHQVLIELIKSHRMINLVMALSFMSFSSWFAHCSVSSVSIQICLQLREFAVIIYICMYYLLLKSFDQYAGNQRVQ